MLKYCYHKWDYNKERLQEAIKNDTKINGCEYEYLVKLVTRYILNGELPPEFYDQEKRWDYDNITKIDNGDYQGTLLFLIPKDWYQPAEYDYLLTYVGYGSCSGCDTLLNIQEGYRYDSDLPTEKQVREYMDLCRHLVSNIVKPYNNGWRNDEMFEHIKMEVV